MVSLLLTSSASFFLCLKVLLDVTVRARLFIGHLTGKELEVEVAVELLVTQHVCEGCVTTFVSTVELRILEELRHCMLVLGRVVRVVTL